MKKSEKTDKYLNLDNEQNRTVKYDDGDTNCS